MDLFKRELQGFESAIVEKYKVLIPSIATSLIQESEFFSFEQGVRQFSVEVKNKSNPDFVAILNLE